VWWSFSSCTQSLAVLESDLFLGKHGSRTLFNVECDNGKMIRSHSYIDVEDEILLLPATQFEVKSKLNPSTDLHLIHLKQVDPPFSLIEPTSITPTVQSTPQVKKNPQRIAQYVLNDKVNFCEQRLIDKDIRIVVQQAIIDKQCSILYLTNNTITDEGAQHLGNVVQSNTSLKPLSMEKNRISGVGVRWIAQALHTNSNSTLTEINLGRNRITDEGVRFLAEVLHVNSTLEELWLQDNAVGISLRL
jgi:hypothetical protein